MSSKMLNPFINVLNGVNLSLWNLITNITELNIRNRIECYELQIAYCYYCIKFLLFSWMPKAKSQMKFWSWNNVQIENCENGSKLKSKQEQWNFILIGYEVEKHRLSWSGLKQINFSRRYALIIIYHGHLKGSLQRFICIFRIHHKFLITKHQFFNKLTKSSTKIKDPKELKP